MTLKTRRSRPVQTRCAGCFIMTTAAAPNITRAALETRLTKSQAVTRRILPRACIHSGKPYLHELESIVLYELRETLQVVASGVDLGLVQGRLRGVDRHHPQSPAGGRVEREPAAVAEPAEETMPDAVKKQQSSFSSVIELPGGCSFSGAAGTNGGESGTCKAHQSPLFLGTLYITRSCAVVVYSHRLGKNDSNQAGPEYKARGGSRSCLQTQPSQVRC